MLLRLAEFISSNEESSFKSSKGNIILSKNVNILRVCKNITIWNFSYCKVFPGTK